MSSLMFVSSLPDLVMFLSLKVLKVCPHAPPPLTHIHPEQGRPSQHLLSSVGWPLDLCYVPCGMAGGCVGEKLRT